MCSEWEERSFSSESVCADLKWIVLISARADLC